MRVALYQPDIPQNAGAILRLCACFGVPLDVIGPSGFVWSDAKLKRAGMDYIAQAHLTQFDTWTDFKERIQGRLVLATTRAASNAYEFSYHSDDILLFGSEGAGVPETIHATVDARIRIPMRKEARSLNVAMSAGMVLAEALRDTDGFPKVFDELSGKSGEHR